MCDVRYEMLDCKQVRNIAELSTQHLNTQYSILNTQIPNPKSQVSSLKS